MKAALDAGATYVWFVDLDTLWCKDVKTACSQLPAAAFEHVIATMQGKRVCRAGIRKSIQKGMLEFLRVPFDYLYPGTPFRVTCRSPLLNALLAEMEAVVATRRRAHDYMVFMHLLGDKVEECGLLGAYQNPAAFSGVPYFTHRSCLVKSEIQVPYKGHKTTVTARDIMKDAIGVNTYWQSGKDSVVSLVERGSDANVGDGSVWADVLHQLNVIMTTAISQCASASSQNDDAPPRRRFSGKTRDPCGQVHDPLPWSAVEPVRDSHGGAFRSAATGRPASTEWEMSDIKRRCSLVRRLGEGSYGRVYSGKYTGEAREVAVKISRADRAHQPISAAEISMLARVQSHDNVVRLRDYFFSPYFVVLVLQGLDIDLFRLLNEHTEHGGLQPAVATHITSLVARGVAHVHLNNIIHRDLHAGNILLSFKSGLQSAIEVGLQPANIVDRVCIADFGQSCDVHDTMQLEKRSMGMGAGSITPPEVYFATKGMVKKPAMYDSAVDVWAIGVNFYLMSAGNKGDMKFRQSSEYLQFWGDIIGKVPYTVARRMGWNLARQWMLADVPSYGSQPVVPLKPVVASSQDRASTSTAEKTMCVMHHTILKYMEVREQRLTCPTT